VRLRYEADGALMELDASKEDEEEYVEE